MREAIAALYTAFEQYPLRSRIGGCPCCATEEAEAPLHTTSLRDLSPGDLEHYVRSAMLTWGTIKDFNHFLPRVFELLVQGDEWIDSEVVFAKLRTGQWRTWPRVEREAVQSYLAAWWALALATTSDSYYGRHGHPPVDSALCSLGQAAEDLSPFLSAWRADRSLTAACQLAWYVEKNAGAVVKRPGLWNSFWEDRPIQESQVVNWLREPETIEHLESAAKSYIDTPYWQPLLDSAEYARSLGGGTENG